MISLGLGDGGCDKRREKHPSTSEKCCVGPSEVAESIVSSSSAFRFYTVQTVDSLAVRDSADAICNPLKKPVFCT